ncbi:hypothetical protein Tco_1058939, partial [Tanacetum coccineum]
LLEAEVDIKKAAEAKNAELVFTLQGQITGEEKIKAAFEEFKRYEDDRVSSQCVEIDARLDALGIDFDEELYPHMLMAIVGRRWVIGHGLRLAVLKCAESMELRQAFANVVSVGIAKDPEVRDPKDPWAFKEELLLKDAIAANVSRAEKKRKCRIVCRTHGVGSAHHTRSDGIPVSVPTAPQGLQILLKDAASQTELPEDGESLRLVRSKSLPAMYNLDWP